MQDSPRPAWLNEVTEAVERWHRVEAGGRGHGKEGGDKAVAKVGQAHPAAEYGAGWFSIPGGENTDESELDEAYLAPGEGGKRTLYRLRDSRTEHGRLYVQVSRNAPVKGMYLWKPAKPKGYLVGSILDGLRDLRPNGLITRFGDGAPDPVPTPVATPPEWGFNTGQRAAFTACVSQGVHLVWGPPGTGKTYVISRTLEHAITHGKSVLLVSGTNVAVDNALADAARRLQPQAGVMLRAGTPHLAEIADNPAVCLTTLKQVAQQEKEDELARVETRLREAHDHPAKREHALAKELLADFDPREYAAARARVGASENVSLLRAKIADAEHEVEIRKKSAEQALRVLKDAEDQVNAISTQAEMLRRANELRRELANHQDRRDSGRVRVADAERRCREIELSLKASSTGGVIKVMTARKRRRSLAADLAVAEQERDRAQNELNELDRILNRRGPRLSGEIAKLERKAAPVTWESLQERRNHYEHARHKAEDGQAQVRAAEKDAARRTAEYRSARNQSQATDADRTLVAHAERNDFPRRHQELPRLAEAALGVNAEIERLEKQRERVEKELADLGRDTERHLIGRASVVACTLATMRLKPAIARRAFDYVIVDECSASSVPEIILAVARAVTGAVLLGDFMQNPPVLPNKKVHEGERRASVTRTWLAPRDCFAFFGVTTPEAATNEPGCVVLTEQHRFGPQITRLVNETAYGGLLTVANNSKQDDVVFVDVDGLGTELAEPKPNPEDGGRGHWWTAGMLISRTLAEQQLSAGKAKTVGIVTPYRIQAELTKEMHAEAGGTPLVDIGTSHRFQGREFSTVIFDMVDHGGPHGWLSGAKLTTEPSGRLSGLKMFNVAVTRARDQLVIIGNEARLRKARTGPFAALRAAIDRHDIRVVHASDVIAVPDPDPLRDDLAKDLWEVAAGFVKYTGLYDETTVPRAFIERIKRAESSIWLWSPWIGRRSRQFLPELEAAQERGVDVRVVALPKDEVNPNLYRFYDEFVHRIKKVLFMRMQHQKIAIIDRKVTLVGSMNLLSHSHGDGGRREIMAMVESEHYAAHMLRFERADELVRRHKCEKCGQWLRVVAFDHEKKCLVWRCDSGPEKEDLHWRREFPALAGTRNQKRVR